MILVTPESELSIDIPWTHNAPELLIPGRKPSGNDITVDKENPLAVGLHRFYLLSPQALFQDLVSGENTLEWQPAAGDQIFIEGNLYLGGNIAPLEKIHDDDFANAPEFSVIGRIKSGNPTTTSWTIAGFNAFQYGWRITNDTATNKIRATLWNTVPAATVVESLFISVSDGVWATVGLTFSTTSNDIRLYMNGELANHDWLSGTYRPATSALDKLSIASLGGFSNVITGECEFLATFKRVLTDAEMKSFMDNPYQVLKPAHSCE